MWRRLLCRARDDFVRLAAMHCIGADHRHAWPPSRIRQPSIDRTTFRTRDSPAVKDTPLLVAE